MAKSESNNIPMSEILKNARGQNVESLMEKLSAADRQKVQSILSDPEEKRKLLSNPLVQELIRKLKNNG